MCALICTQFAQGSSAREGWERDSTSVFLAPSPAFSSPAHLLPTPAERTPCPPAQPHWLPLDLLQTHRPNLYGWEKKNPSDYTWEGGPKGRDSVVHQGFQLESLSIREAGRQAPLPRVEGAPYPTAKEDRDAAWPERGVQWRSWWKPITPGILRSPIAAGRRAGCRDFTCTEEHCSGNGHATGTGTAPRQHFSPTLSPPELQLKTHRRRLSTITVRSSAP